MTRMGFTIAIGFLCITAAAAPLVTYESPCECGDNHGKHRWAEKNDPAPPPTDASAIQGVNRQTYSIGKVQQSIWWRVQNASRPNKNGTRLRAA